MDLTVVILTYNEEKNLPQAIASVAGWAKEIVVLDSFSTDGTVQLAQKAGARVFQRKFDNYAAQRKHALQACDIQTPWLFFLDADEWLMPELKAEISSLLATDPVENGFYMRCRLLWRGRWIRRGYYAVWFLRLARTKEIRVEERSVNEHLLVNGPTKRLRYDFYNENHNGIQRWHEKHLKYARLEAEEALKTPSEKPRLWGANARPKRWIQYYIWKNLPPLVRPWLFFGYRYFLLGGFLDGRQAFSYHFLQGLWLHTLISLEIENIQAGKDL